MIIVLIIFWALLGLTVFFIAMRRGQRRPGGVESKAGQRLIIAAVVALIAFGLVIPALVLASNKNNKASVAVGGVRLTAGEQRGREMFAHTCGLCHTLQATNSVGRTGPNLDIRVGDDIATPAGRRALVLSAIAEGRARGLGQMPAQLYQGKEAEEVASFVAAVAGH